MPLPLPSFFKDAEGPVDGGGFLAGACTRGGGGGAEVVTGALSDSAFDAAMVSVVCFFESFRATCEGCSRGRGVYSNSREGQRARARSRTLPGSTRRRASRAGEE
eukprot:30721-Pelagococcus_subviridis.AAC.6